METAEEKAKRLGVPLKHTPNIQPLDKKEETSILRNQKTANDYLQEMAGRTVAVCQTCNKELTIQQQHPCGNMLCPYGYYQM